MWSRSSYFARSYPMVELTYKDIHQQEEQELLDAEARAKNVWTWETCLFTLTNPKGETVELNSLYINDVTLGLIREDLEKYVKDNHNGVLE